MYLFCILYVYLYVHIFYCKYYGVSRVIETTVNEFELIRSDAVLSVSYQPEHSAERENLLI